MNIDEGTEFLIFEAHARKYFLILTSGEGLVNSTSPAIYIVKNDTKKVILTNPHPINISAVGQYYYPLCKRNLICSCAMPLISCVLSYIFFVY